MSKRMSQKEIKRRIDALKVKQRNGLMWAIIAFLAMVALIATYVNLQSQGVYWTTTSFGSLVPYIAAVIAAGFAGVGTRKWKKARDEIKKLEKKLK